MIYLATDHRGFELKEKIKTWLLEWGYEHQDMGAHKLDPEDDYPDFVLPAAQKISEDPTGNKAIVLGATGQGEAMVANRLNGVRAAVFYGPSLGCLTHNTGDDGCLKLREIIIMSREHNDANILSIGASFVGDEIKDFIKLWLETKFADGVKHMRRIKKIDL